ncbi:hypothetical protein HBHAL_4490 [Halobacillus halophilus DSM 2266]|uniref:Uncharacterized protein n=1 Tax=Halobacillus halophilus (strain ATCC 35676 / DSM 2266 / JCM 20832 / KCTC 3685 / LMG 17431 / NBRC 102448 / NCIMB 2269) TaxID=866895 RepID=I0JRQ9_HALH3|nr:hypothetical protein HBHAL_4490 [Halobacillus halophilus DSM 2266]
MAVFFLIESFYNILYKEQNEYKKEQNVQHLDKFRHGKGDGGHWQQ